MRAIIIFLTLFTVSGAAASQDIQLLDKEMYLRTGFDISWTAMQQFDSSWTKLKADPERKQMRITDQNLPGLPKRSFLSITKEKPKNFTLVIPFVNNNDYTSPGLYIHRMGNNWEVYLNGNLIRREVYLDEQGAITKKRNLRHIHILFKPAYLKQGGNTLAIRIIGDPTNQENGISLFPVYIGENETIIEKSSETVTLMLIFVYFVIGIYHIFLFLSNRKEVYNLFFGLVSVEFFLYIFFRTQIVYSLIPHSDIVIKGELTILYTIIPTFGAFAGLIIKKKIDLLTKIFSVFYLLLIVMTIPAPESFQEDLLRIWQATVIIPTFYYLGYTIGLSFVSQVRRLYGKGIGFVKSFFISLGLYVPGNLLIGMSVVVSCMFFDIYDAIYLNLGLSTSRYGFFFLILGIAMVLSNRFLYIYKTVERLNISLEEKIQDLNQANRKISLSEEKYRVLVEGANEVIFTLDAKYCFKTVNRAIRTKLGIPADEITGVTFFEFLSRSSGGRSVEFHYINEKFDELEKQRKPVFFKIDYTMPATREVIDLNVRLEHINIEGSDEILGKISRVSEDALLKTFVKENASYNISSQLTTAEEISHRMTRNLVRYMEAKDVNMTRIAIREIIINAIEHGNFELSFEEKSEALNNESYFETIAMRQRDPRYSGRTVEIDYAISPDRAEFTIKDHGRGFDHTKIFQRAQQSNDEMLGHGRGIMMALNLFDEIKYNDIGNQVLLVKNFKAESNK